MQSSHKGSRLKWQGLSYFDYLYHMLNGRDKDFTPLSQPDLPETDIRLIAFYLPQFHPIPENDEWWGKGFTEWTNVTKALPQFFGHYQPRLPGELGYYDLRNPEVHERQVTLAKQYGIHGFCFHFYWFGGKRLLEKPLELFIANPAIDFPFCINWANENWSRRWDGRDTDVLIAQKHSPEDDLAFIQYVSRYLKHPNYIKINSKPLLIVYRLALLPEPARTAERWREWCRENGIGELYLALTHSFEHVDPGTIGFDAAIEFAPNTFPLSDFRGQVKLINPRFSGHIFDYQSAVTLAKNYRKPTYKKFRGICPGWDNEPRRAGRSTVLANASPDAYRKWLQMLCEFTTANFTPEERFIFINAWNEWAEGAYLEPDRRYGYAYLQATAAGVTSWRKPALPHDSLNILFVSHDVAVGGAQAVLLDIISWVRKHTFIDLKIICLQGGDWLYRFKELGDTLVLSELGSVISKKDFNQHLDDFFNHPFNLIYCNSIATGKASSLLKPLNIPTIMHFHELGMSIERYAADCIDDVLKDYSHFIACSGAVRNNLMEKYEVDPTKISTVYSSIRPDNAIKMALESEQKGMKKNLGIEDNTFLVFGCGLTMAFRKGADLFLDVARILLKKEVKNFRFLWVGGFDKDELDDKGETWGNYLSNLESEGLDKYVTFLGLRPDPRQYFRSGDVFLVTSRDDPFPLVGLEAAECGLPVICFADAGGMPDFVENDAGFVVPFADTEAMAEKIMVLMDNSNLRRQLGARAREKLLEKFTPDQTAPHILSVCRKVAEKKPVVTVIVPTYNHARYLPARLDSIFGQTFKDFEVIILDDASTDNSNEVIEKYKDRADVRIVRNEQNTGSPFPQWLKGFALAQADILWIAESDDVSAPKFLESLLPSFEQPDVKLAYADSYVIDEEGRITGDYVSGEYLTSLSQTKWTNSYQVSATEEINDGLGVKNTILNISSALFRKPVMTEEFRETLNRMRIAGDWYFIVRVIKNGKVHFDKRRLNYHRRHGESVIGKMVSEKKLEDFFGDFSTVQQFVVSHYELDSKFYRKWEGYLSKQWNDFCPGRPFEEVKAYYPLDIIRDKILANAAKSAKNRTQESPPTVSIIIPLFNNLEFTKRCISSITENTSPDIYELILVDNGSTDGTVAYLDSLATHTIRVIRNKQNLGFAKACNQGANAAQGTYLLFLNNDTEVQYGWMEPLLTVLNEDPSVAACGSKLLFPDGTIQHAGLMVIDDRALPDPLVARHIYYQKPSTFVKANCMTTYQALTAACLMVRRSAFEDIEGFDEEYWNGYEDVDLCFKLQQKGWRLVYNHESVVIHHESKSGPERFRKVRENIERLHKKWLGIITPDFIIEKNGSATQTNASHIRRYVLPESITRGGQLRSDATRDITSIIILTHNQLKHTKLCIESIQRLTPEPHEIIIVDNGSTDGTLEYLKSQIEIHDEMKVIANASNRGFSSGNNQGISIAKGEFILLLNNDTIVTEGWLGRMLNIFKNFPKTGIVGPMSNYVRGVQCVQKADYNDLDDMEAFASQWTLNNEGKTMASHRVVGFCLLAKKEVIKRIGGLDEIFGSGNYEDDDFCIRAALEGYEIRIAQDVFIHHTGSQTFIGSGIDYRHSMLRNRNLFKEKWGFLPFQFGGRDEMIPSLPPGKNLLIPLPDVASDHTCDVDKHWWEESGIRERVENYDEETIQDGNRKEAGAEVRAENLVSIVLLVTGRQDITKGCLKSIKRYIPEPYELIVVPYNTAKVPSKLLRKVLKDNINYKIIQYLHPSHDSTKGRKEAASENLRNFAFSCNQAIKKSTGEYIVLLTDEIVVSDSWLTGMIEHLRRSDDIGIVGPMIINGEGRQGIAIKGSGIQGAKGSSGNPIKRSSFTGTLELSSPEFINDYVKAFRERNRHRRITVKSLIGPCIMFRHELFRKLGPFDEQFLTGKFTIDDFCLRAAAEKYCTLIAGDTVVYLHKPADPVALNRKISIDRRSYLGKWGDPGTEHPAYFNLLTLSVLAACDEFKQKGQGDKAVSALIEGLQNNPNDERLHYALVDLLLEMKKLLDADDVLKSMPDLLKHTPAWLELAGVCKAALQENDDAEGYADQLLSRDTTSVKALNLKGILAFNRGELAEAERFFNGAIASDPGFGEAYANLGGLKWSSQDFETAFDLIERAFVLSPVSESIVTNYHSAAVALSQVERASPLFREAVSLHPSNRRLKYMLADLLLQQNSYHEAMDVLENALLAFDMDNDSLALAGALREKIGPKTIEKGLRIQGSEGSNEKDSRIQVFKDSSETEKQVVHSGPRTLESSNPTLSVCMIVKDEEKNIGKCLHKIEPLADEIIVIDTGSTDRTRDIAKVFGAKVYDFAWTDSFSDARNYSISQASGDWILVLDADETIAPADFEKLRERIAKGPKEKTKGSRGQGAKGSKKEGSRIQGIEGSSDLTTGTRGSLDPASFVFSFTTRNYVLPINTPGWVANDGTYLDEEAGTGWLSSTKVRLFPNDRRIRFEAPVHEFVEGSVVNAGMSIRECPVPIHHYGKLDTEKITSKARQYYELGKAKYLERGEEDTLSLFELAVQASELEKFDEALEWWNNLIALNPDFSKAYYGLGNTYFRIGRFKDAARVIEKAIQTARTDTEWRDAVILFSHAAACVGKTRETIQYLNQLLKKQPGDPLASMLFAAVHLFAGEEGKGMELLEGLKRNNYDLAEFLAQYAKHLSDHGESSLAHVLLSAAIKINMVTNEVPALIAECERKLEEIDEQGSRIQGSEGSNEKDSRSQGFKDSSETEKHVVLSGPRTLEPSNPTLSVCMIVKNEENNIRRALEGVRPLVDEMVVVDTGSTDKTREIAQEMGAKVYDFPWTDSFAEARNFSLSKATKDWILVVDADEVISPEDHEALKELIKGSRVQGFEDSSDLLPGTQKSSNPATLAYSLTTRNYITEINTPGWTANNGSYPGYEAGAGWFPSRKVRLFPNDRRIYFEAPVHELAENSLAAAGIDIRDCLIPVHHYGMLDSSRRALRDEQYYELGRAKWIEGGAQDLAALFELAKQATTLRRFEDALEYWNKLVEHNPDFSKGFYGLGSTYFTMHRFEDAAASLRKAVSSATNHAEWRDAVILLAHVALFAGRYEESLSLLNGLREKEPGHPMACFFIAAAYVLINEEKSAVTHLEEFKRLQFEASRYLIDLARQFMSAGEYSPALSLLNFVHTHSIAPETLQALIEECHEKIKNSKTQKAEEDPGKIQSKPG